MDDSDNLTFDMEKLIAEVQKRPALWDMRAPEYSDRIKKRTSWEEIINLFSNDNATKEEKKILDRGKASSPTITYGYFIVSLPIGVGQGMSRTTLQKKWKNARGRYSRDIHKRTGKSGQGAKKRAPYVYAAQMSFLEDTVQHRATGSSMNADELEHSQTLLEEVQRDEDSQTFQALNETNVGLNLQQPNTGTSSNLSVQLTENVKIGKKRKMPVVEAKLIEALDYNAKRRDRKENEEDDDRLFLLSLLPHLQLLPPHLKLSARINILEAINKYTIQPATNAPTSYVQLQSAALQYQQTPNQLHQPHFYLPQSQHLTYQQPDLTRYSADKPAHQQTQFHIHPQATENTSVHQQGQWNTCTQPPEITSRTATPLPSPSESVRSYFSNYSTEDSNVSVF